MSVRLFGTIATIILIGAGGCANDTEPTSPTTASGSAATSTTSSVVTTDEGSPDGDTSRPTSAPGASSTHPPRPAEELAGEPGLPPQLPPPEPVDEGASAAVASELAAEPGCASDDPTVAVVPLSWQPAGGDGDQLVMVSTRQDGFETGTYASSERLGADASSYELRGSQAGGVFYWRVATDVGGRWVASEVATFTGPTCAAF